MPEIIKLTFNEFHSKPAIINPDGPVCHIFLFENQETVPPVIFDNFRKLPQQSVFVVIFNNKWPAQEFLKSVPIDLRKHVIIDFPFKTYAEDKNLSLFEAQQEKLDLTDIGYTRYSSDYLNQANLKYFDTVALLYDESIKNSLLLKKQSTRSYRYTFIKLYDELITGSFYYKYIQHPFYRYLHKNYYKCFHAFITKPYHVLNFQYKKRIKGEVKRNHSNS